MLPIIHRPLLLTCMGIFCLLIAHGCNNTHPLDIDKGRAIVEGAKCDESLAFTCPGAAMPEFSLVDFQPRSKRLEETYGLEQFKGEVTLVALLASW